MLALTTQQATADDRSNCHENRNKCQKIIDFNYEKYIQVNTNVSRIGFIGFSEISSDI